MRSGDWIDLQEQAVDVCKGFPIFIFIQSRCECDAGPPACQLHLAAEKLAMSDAFTSVSDLFFNVHLAPYSCQNCCFAIVEAKLDIVYCLAVLCSNTATPFAHSCFFPGDENS